MADERAGGAAGRIGRRGFLAGAVGCAAWPGAGRRGVGSAAAQSGPPAVQWTREYVDEGGQLLGLQVAGTADGGFVLAGRTGDEEFPATAVVKTDGSGDREWTTAVDDGDGLTRQQPVAVIETSDGEYVVAGYGGYGEEPDDHRRHTAVARVARLDDDGEIRWTRQFDAYEADDRDPPPDEEIYEDSAMFLDAAATGDGGAIAGGYRGAAPWVAKLDGAGEVAWERTVDAGRTVEQVLPDADGGFALIGTPSEDGLPCPAVHVGPDGTVRRRVALDVDDEVLLWGAEFATTADGGYAYTGATWSPRDLLLAKLDREGRRAWDRRYDGPAGGFDRGTTVKRAADGGFLIGGHVETQPEGAPRPALVRTGPDGARRWLHVLYEPAQIVGDTGYARVVETADGGYAALARPWLVKLGPDGTGGEPTETATATTTPGAEPTSDDGAGPGALAGLAGLAALGTALRARRRED